MPYDPQTPRAHTSMSKETGVALNLEWTGSRPSYSQHISVKGKRHEHFSRNFWSGRCQTNTILQHIHKYTHTDATNHITLLWILCTGLCEGLGQMEGSSFAQNNQCRSTLDPFLQICYTTLGMQQIIVQDYKQAIKPPQHACTVTDRRTKWAIHKMLGSLVKCYPNISCTVVHPAPLETPASLPRKTSPLKKTRTGLK